VAGCEGAGGGAGAGRSVWPEAFGVGVVDVVRDHLPVGLDLRGRLVVALGGGAECVVGVDVGVLQLKPALCALLVRRHEMEWLAGLTEWLVEGGDGGGDEEPERAGSLVVGLAAVVGDKPPLHRAGGDGAAGHGRALEAGQVVQLDVSAD
jgi:hypothetical protein